MWTTPNKKEMEPATVVPERNPVALTNRADTESRRRELRLISLGKQHSGPRAEDSILVSSFPTHVSLEDCFLFVISTLSVHKS